MMRRPQAVRLDDERGTTLIETAVAIGIVMVVMIGLLGMAGLATKYTENQGHLGARTTEYAQDKMEQLMALAYGDATSNTTVFPATTTGGTGLTVGGSANPAVVAAGYVDWLDSNGNLLLVAGTAAPAGWYYKRVWQITSPSANLKQLTVTTIVKTSVANAQLPQSTVAALKTSPF